MSKDNSRLNKLCAICEDAAPAVCAVTITVSGFGRRQDRKQASTGSMRCCRKCVRAIAKVMTQQCGRTGLHVVLDEVIG